MLVRHRGGRHEVDEPFLFQGCAKVGHDPLVGRVGRVVQVQEVEGHLSESHKRSPPQRVTFPHAHHSTTLGSNEKRTQRERRPRSTLPALHPRVRKTWRGTLQCEVGASARQDTDRGPWESPAATRMNAGRLANKWWNEKWLPSKRRSACLQLALLMRPSACLLSVAGGWPPQLPKQTRGIKAII